MSEKYDPNAKEKVIIEGDDPECNHLHVLFSYCHDTQIKVCDDCGYQGMLSYSNNLMEFKPRTRIRVLHSEFGGGADYTLTKGEQNRVFTRTLRERVYETTTDWYLLNLLKQG